MTHMNWNKFFTGTTDDDHQNDKDETESDDEEDITGSNATASTDKKPYFLGIGFHKFSSNRLSKRCIKFVFIVLNSAMFLAGIVGSVISIWTLTDNLIMSRLIGQRLFVTTLLLMSLIASFVSLFGIFGLLKKRRNFLNIYAWCYLLFLCVIFISAIMSFRIFEEIIRRIHTDMVSSIRHYDSLPSSKEAWDNTHRYLKCCGINSSNDWAKYSIDIPKSCCSRSIEECLQMTHDVSYESGCLKNAVLLLKSHVHAISISTVLLFLIAVSVIIVRA
ncbi:CD151 antigen-like [Osmia bicornis bicornis]|uniref:CD151 antigen-like n=1 Tax=Osmia bicornis bicornis TaxID=1437191 RepID=UPI0010F9BA83|nr:CD151 antigen-like [Osmia bicornis bicornis]